MSHRGHHKQNKLNIRSNALYHLLGNDFVSKCFFAGIFPWSPVAHFCIVKEILEYDHCCNVALHCSHSVTLCPNLLLLNVKIFYWNQQLPICSSVYKYYTILVGFNFSQFPPKTSEYFITWIMQMSGCSALINISAVCVLCCVSQSICHSSQQVNSC